jgi:hypothetical protein
MLVFENSRWILTAKMAEFEFLDVLGSSITIVKRYICTNGDDYICSFVTILAHCVYNTGFDANLLR